MAQTGCPQGTGTGGSGKKLKAEFNKEPHVRGTTSMARAASPDSGDSQFFICFDDASFLNNQYTVWGKVTEGMENVDKIKRGEPVKESRQDHQGADGCGRGLAVIPGHAKREPGIPIQVSGFRIAALRAASGMTVQNAHRPVRLRTSRQQHRAAAGAAARFRADAGGAARCGIAGSNRCRSSAIAAARRPVGGERYQGDRGAAHRPPHRPRRPSRRSRRR